MKQEAENNTSVHYAIDCLIADVQPPANAVVSRLMTSQPIHNPPPGECDLPELFPGFEDDVRRSLEESGLPSLSLPDADGNPGLFIKDPFFPWDQPGFDCDDYADAAAGWFHHHLEQMYPGMVIEIIGIAALPGGGHAILRVCYLGICVYIDPQTGHTYQCMTTCTVAELAVHPRTLKVTGRGQSGSRSSLLFARLPQRSWKLRSMKRNEHCRRVSNRKP